MNARDIQAWVDDLDGDQYREVQIRHYGVRHRGEGNLPEPPLVVARAYRAPTGARGVWAGKASGATAGEALAGLAEVLDGGQGDAQ